MPHRPDQLHPKVAEVGGKISEYLNEIAQLFKPGAKLTLVVRHPSHPAGDQDMVLTNDQLPLAIKAIEQRIAEDA